MAIESAAAFWSYTHEDDRHDNGAILRLAERIGEEYSLNNLDDLVVFVDRKDLAWGDHWKQRIDNALVSTTFFIPIVTPRYFRSEECRRELFEFARHANALGVSELICPILYAPVQDLDEDNSDEAIALIARAQYENWTSLRLSDEKSEEHRRAVNRLAARLAEVGRTVGSRQTKQEGELDEDEEKAGLSETLDEIRTLLPEWIEAVESAGLVREQFLATDLMLEERKRKRRVGPPGARYVIFRQQVAEYLPLMERQTEIAERVLRKTVELSPAITRAFRIVREHPEDKSALQELADSLRQADDAFKDWGGPKESVSEWARRNADKTRGMLTLAREVERGDSIRAEIGAELEVWSAELRELKITSQTAHGEDEISLEPE
jgi:hypothetical protein